MPLKGFPFLPWLPGGSELINKMLLTTQLHLLNFYSELHILNPSVFTITKEIGTVLSVL